MTEFNPPRRGRPPKGLADLIAAEKGEIAAPAPVAEKPAKAPERRRRAKIGEHALKLKAPERAGYKRRFALATPNRIAELEDLGYTVVTDASIPTSGLGSGTVQRPAGTGAGGAYNRHILMETPDELYAQGRDEIEAQNRKVDQSIRGGRDNTGQLDHSYGEGSINVSRG